MLQPAKDSIDVGIFVKDISTMLDFYQGTLGLEKTEEVPTAFGTIHRFRHGTSDIKLMDPKEVPPPHQTVLASAWASAISPLSLKT